MFRIENPHMRVKICSALAALALCTVPAFSQQVPSKKLQVVIIAVSRFDDDGWDNPQLQMSIEKSANDLEQFFRKRFPDAELHLLTDIPQKQPHTGSTSAGNTSSKVNFPTTTAAIRDFLRGEFHTFADGTVTLFFILSHGKPETSPNPNFNQDLLIVTSDTSQSNPNAKALSVAQDLITEFARLKSPNSIVLAFLDTCYSGAAVSLNMRLTTTVAETYGLRFMVMASSLSESQSYKATFSEALLDLWNKASGRELHSTRVCSKGAPKFHCRTTQTAAVRPYRRLASRSYPLPREILPRIFCRRQRSCGLLQPAK